MQMAKLPWMVVMYAEGANFFCTVLQLTHFFFVVVWLDFFLEPPCNQKEKINNPWRNSDPVRIFTSKYFRYCVSLFSLSTSCAIEKLQNPNRKRERESEFRPKEWNWRPTGMKSVPCCRKTARFWISLYEKYSVYRYHIDRVWNLLFIIRDHFY